MIGQKISCHFLNQSEAKAKAIVPCFAFCCMRLTPVTCICLSSDWFIGSSASVVIGQNDYFGFGFMTLKTALMHILPNMPHIWTAVHNSNKKSLTKKLINNKSCVHHFAKIVMHTNNVRDFWPPLWFRETNCFMCYLHKNVVWESGVGKHFDAAFIDFFFARTWKTLVNVGEKTRKLLLELRF